jgi:hypothetical protein
MVCSSTTVPCCGLTSRLGLGLERFLTMRVRRKRPRPRTKPFLLFFLLVLLVMASLQVCFFRSILKEDDDRNLPSHRSWAYVFLVADCDPKQPSYRGSLYNILASTYLLKFNDDDDDDTPSKNTSNSKADVVVLIQMAATSQSNRLPSTEEALLERMHIQVKYLPKPLSTPTFYELVLTKFRVLEMVDYSRVLFLDGDVLPLCNLDYLLQLSEEGILQETVLHAMYEDPVNAGLWVVAPSHESYLQVQGLIEQHKEQEWDPNVGWGDGRHNHQHHPSVVDDSYRLWNMQQGSGWKFYCADSDQGLLLYWSKLIRQQVSIIVGPTVEQYDGSTTPNIVASHFLSHYSCLPLGAERATTFSQNANDQASTLPFYQDFYHMVGYSKAWEQPLRRPIPTRKEQVESSMEYWYFALQNVVEKFDEGQVIPPLDNLHQSLGKPRIRGDLFAVGDGTRKPFA